MIEPNSFIRSLETEEENSRAVRSFRQRLKEVASNLTDMEWGFPNGDRHKFPTYSIPTYLGEIQIAVPKSWDTRVAHLIRFKKEQGPPSSDVEINIPITHDRQVSGLYIKSDNDYLLCSRGSFTSYRGQINREFTFSKFDKWLLKISDKGKLVAVIPVCSISSPTIANDIATFVKAVIELKQAYKATEEQIRTIENTTSPKTIFGWGKGTEFEGIKAVGGGLKEEYEYLHGPLCNQLIAFLKKVNSSDKSVYVDGNRHVDAAIIDVVSQLANSIFEVKTSALPSNQIYSAVGQLYYYKFLHGHANTKLYLVLPSYCQSIETQNFFERLGIEVVYGESGKFKFPSGKCLDVGL